MITPANPFEDSNRRRREQQRPRLAGSGLLQHEKSGTKKPRVSMATAPTPPARVLSSITQHVGDVLKPDSIESKACNRRRWRHHHHLHHYHHKNHKHYTIIIIINRHHHHHHHNQHLALQRRALQQALRHLCDTRAPHYAQSVIK